MFLTFLLVFFLKQYWNGNVDIVHLETIPKESENELVEHQNAQKLEFLQKPPVELIFKNMRIWYLNENVDIVHLEKIPKDSENVSVEHEKEWIGQDSGPDGSQNPQKWAFENTYIPPK